MYAEVRRDATRIGAGWLHLADTNKSWKCIDVWGNSYAYSSLSHHNSLIKMGYGRDGVDPCENLADGLNYGAGQVAVGHGANSCFRDS